MGAAGVGIALRSCLGGREGEREKGEREKNLSYCRGSYLGGREGGREGLGEGKKKEKSEFWKAAAWEGGMERKGERD